MRGNFLIVLADAGSFACLFLSSILLQLGRTRVFFCLLQISKEELENEPIAEMASQEGVKVLVIQVKKSSRGGSGDGRSSPGPNSPDKDEVWTLIRSCSFIYRTDQPVCKGSCRFLTRQASKVCKKIFHVIMLQFVV